jgi:hypothetical protein
VVIEPKRARDQVEEILRGLKDIVPHDTVSLQILYRGRLQIVACVGFENLEGVDKEDVYKLEFPAYDRRFPNHLVVKSQRFAIRDATNFPSFQVPGYVAGHIKTWMGVPLLHPATGELFGLLSVDSSRPNAYTQADGRRAQQFANHAASYLVEAALGPAALSLMAKRQNIEHLLGEWAAILPKETRRWEDGLQAAKDLVKHGQRIFHVEDCSISFVHHVLDPDGLKEKVLRLVASSAIPEPVFAQYQSRVTGKPKDGLTGRAVHLNRTLNYGKQKLQKSPYWARYTAHLEFLFSKESRQVLIAPLRNSRGEAVGAIKFENRMGQASEAEFSPLEAHLFEVFAAMASLILENIRQRNFVDRQMQDVHSLRTIVLSLAKAWADDYVKRIPTVHRRADDRQVQHMRMVTEYCESVLHGLLIEGDKEQVLENEGVAPAVHGFVNALIKTNLPWYAPACQRIKVVGMEVRDNLPNAARTVFYNIVREGVRNIARHSGIDEKPDGEASVRFSLEDGAFEMTIEDNGRGYLMENPANPLTNFGLKDIQKQFDRLENLGCLERKEIVSAPGKGTRIAVRWKPRSS